MDKKIYTKIVYYFILSVLSLFLFSINPVYSQIKPVIKKTLRSSTTTSGIKIKAGLNIAVINEFDEIVLFPREVEIDSPAPVKGKIKLNDVVGLDDNKKILLSVEQLVSGVSDEEKNNHINSFIPKGTKIKSCAVKNRTDYPDEKSVDIELSEEITQRLDDYKFENIMSQLRWTLMSNDIEKVTFIGCSVNGKPLQEYIQHSFDK